MAPPTSSTLSLAVHGSALIVIYTVYGLLQEKIVKNRYDGEHFGSPSLLILCNRLFAMILAVLIIAWRDRGSGSLSHQMRPSSPLSSFAIVAAYNFLATSCQYQALAHVSFTTASVAKCTKCIPVILVQYFVYRRGARPREWIAALVVMVGYTTYLVTLKSDPSPLDSDDAFLNTILGALFLAGYLFFDGLTSTSQERFFGISSSSTDPFGPTSSVLPQMIWVNLFTSLLAFAGMGIDLASGTLVPSFRLLASSSSLQLDVLGLSATAAVGLIVLLNMIASFGALTSSFVMTIRQFISVLVNAGVFRHYGSVGVQGWTGVGWVASGVWIKMDRRWDETKAVDGTADEEGLLSDKEEEEEVGRGSSSPASLPYLSSPSSHWTPFANQLKRYLVQYGIPLLAPLLLAIVLSQLDLNLDALTLHPEDLDSNAEGGVDETEYAVIEGGDWEVEMHSALWPQCHNRSESVRWEGDRRTALASYPRSGNTFTRELVERATGLQTSTVTYCDGSLSTSFPGECDHTAKFLVKTHYPERFTDRSMVYTSTAHFDQAVHLIRNPVDALYSAWQLAHVPKTEDGQLDHTGRLDIEKLGRTTDQRADIITRAKVWGYHEQFWHDVPIPVHPIRYEDLMKNRLATVMGLLTFILPTDELPSLSNVTCITELDEAKEAYKSRKADEFASWNLWDVPLRTHIIKTLRVGWCRHGYDRLLRAARGRDTAVDTICETRSLYDE